MAQPTKEIWHIDPDDPRAPSLEVWAKLSQQMRDFIVQHLPSTCSPEVMPPEGDFHKEHEVQVIETLRSYLSTKHKRVYVSGDLFVYYPNEPRFAPDVFVVFDVDDHQRQSWVVANENKGLDWVLEITVSGDYKKDAVTKVALYERLGVAEMFLYDAKEQTLSGYRLNAKTNTYEQVHNDKKTGQMISQVLGLWLVIEKEHLRFYDANGPLETMPEKITKLNRLVQEGVARHQAEYARAEAERLAKEQEQKRAEAERLAKEQEQKRAEAERLAKEQEKAAREAAEKRVKEAEQEIERLKALLNKKST